MFSASIQIAEDLTNKWEVSFYKVMFLGGTFATCQLDMGTSNTIKFNSIGKRTSKDFEGWGNINSVGISLGVGVPIIDLSASAWYLPDTMEAVKPDSGASIISSKGFDMGASSYLAYFELIKTNDYEHESSWTSLYPPW